MSKFLFLIIVFALDMKVLFGLLLWSTSALATTTGTATQKYVTEINFNNGLAPELTKTCPPQEWSLILATMEGAASSNRTGTNSGVRGRNLDVNASQNRQLARTKCGCFGFCGFVHGCPALAKRRRRRHRDLQATSTQYASPLSNTTQCAADLAAITAALIQLPPKLSTPCQALLAAPRTVYCHKAVPCGIDHVSVWNAMNNSQVVSHFPTSGGMLCARDKQTLAAEVNYEPDRVYCTLTGGPRSDMKFVNTEYGEPFFLHTKYGSDIRGMYFEPGNYTLRMVGDNGTQPLTVTFGMTNQC